MQPDQAYSVDDREVPFAFRHGLTRASEGARKGERTRAALMVALCDVLDAVPLSAVTVSMVCDRAGVSHGTLYSHFENRDALVGEALVQFTAFVQERMQAAARQGHGSAVRAATWAYLRLFEANLGLMRVMLRDLDGFERAREAFQALNRDWLGRVVAARARQLEQIGTPVDRDELMRRAYALGGMTDQYLAGLWLDRDPHMQPFSQDREALIDTLNLLWERGLQP